MNRKTVVLLCIYLKIANLLIYQFLLFSNDGKEERGLPHLNKGRQNSKNASLAVMPYCMYKYNKVDSE